MEESWQIEIQNLKEKVLSGAVILYPTDTLWGLGCDARNESAIRRLYDIKKRDPDKKAISLVPQSTDIFRYVSAPPIDILDILGRITQPTSIVYEDVLGISPLVLDNYRGAIRVVNQPFLKSLLKQLDIPIIASSANISGDKSPMDFSEISDEIISSVDYISHPLNIEKWMTGKASDIFKIDKEGNLTRLR